jgi:hypothetical protein
MGEIEAHAESNNPISGMVMIFADRDNEPIRSTINQVPLYVQSDNVAQVLLDENGDKIPNNDFSSAAVLSYDSNSKTYSTGITSHVNAIFRGDLVRQDWLLYATTPTTGDDFKRSLRQFKVNKERIKVNVIYSKSR